MIRSQLVSKLLSASYCFILVSPSEIKKPDKKSQRRLHRKREKREFKRRRQKKKASRSRSGRSTGNQGYKSDELSWKKYVDTIKPIRAPDNFSFVLNTEETLEFLEAIKRKSVSRRRVKIDLRFVKSIDTCALTVMNCIVQDLINERGAEFLIDRPHNKKANRLLNRSGFTKLIRNSTFNEGELAGRFGRRTGDRVEPEMAGEFDLPPRN